MELLPGADRLRGIGDERANVLHFLRGGLNFGLVEGLSTALGMNRQRASFVTSERARDESGRWYIREDQYVKLTLAPGSVVFAGDIVATGITVAAGFAKLAERISGVPRSELPPEIRQHLFQGLDEPDGTSGEEQPPPATPITEIVFFTIGCHKIEKMLEVYDEFFSGVFPEYRGTTVVYVEGKFHLADSKTPVRLKVPGTDLLRHPATIPPELFLSQYDRVTHPLEACAIYDGGSRSFHVGYHLEEARGYWKRVETLARDEGWSLIRALKERWPDDDLGGGPAAVQAWADGLWPDADPDVVKGISEAWAGRWTEEFTERASSPRALIEVCKERLAALESS